MSLGLVVLQPVAMVTCIIGCQGALESWRLHEESMACIMIINIIVIIVL